MGRAVQRTLDPSRGEPEEEAWVERIEAHRRELGTREGSVRCAVGRRGRSARISYEHMSGLVSTAPRGGRLLLWVVRALRPRTCLELGTGAGFSMAYESAALELNGGGRLIGVEASEDCAALTRETLSAVGLEGSSQILVGRGEERIDDAVQAMGPLEFAYEDEDHRPAATIAVADRLIEALAPGGVLLIDDIHLAWSGMHRAWRAIERDPRLAVAADCGKTGVCVRG